ncbi:50S ribosomal protein L10 [Candidatus Phytoplasma fraxini]|uniref:Large ribosomal subunit protein uL10 n=1 Tax=Ash yellows phytoplasma TaxID=35780 RepID=A0ABZ2U896_ASHYP
MTNQTIIEQKKEDVEILIQNITKSDLVVLFEYQGSKVSDLTELRIELRKINSRIQIFPNNILKRAFSSINYNELVTSSKYSKALLFSSKDSITPIKVLCEFAKQNENLKICKGIMGNKICSYEHINELAVLPSKEHLLAMLSSSMMFSLKTLTIALNMLVNK